MPLYRPTVAPAQYFPADHNLAGWAYDPQSTINSASMVNGTLYLIAVPVRTAAVISTLYVQVGTAAVTPTAGQNALGLYSSTGTLLSSAVSDTILTGTGPRSGTLAAPQSVSAGFVWVGVLGNAATPAALGRNIGNAALANLGLTLATNRFCVNGTGLTTLPGTITPASNTQTGAVTFWAAAG